MYVNEQTEFFRSLIARAKDGDAAAIGTMRDICRNAVDAAPDYALIRLGQFFYDLRIEEARSQIQKN